MTAPTLRWRHFVEIGHDPMWVAISASESSVEVRVTGRFRSVTVDHADTRRIAPTDLEDRRIVLDELDAIIAEALPEVTASGVMRAVMRDIRANLRPLTN